MKKSIIPLLAICIFASSCSDKPVEPINEPDNPVNPSVDTVYKVEDYYNGYYVPIKSWENGDDLKNQLHTLINGGTYKPLPYVYSVNRDADHTNTDLEYLDIIYNSKDAFTENTNNEWQREHCFPASLMCGSSTSDAVKFLGRATDYHNLWAGDSSANSSRGNKNYGNADPELNDYTDRTTNNKNDGYSFDELHFEPGNKDKGIVARSIFYMATMYSKDTFDTVNNITMKGLQITEELGKYVGTGTNQVCTFSIGCLSNLLDWNKYEVSDLEMQHNVSVYSFVCPEAGYAQGNRNPYTDYPELVDYVFGDKKNEAGKLENLKPSIVSLDREENAELHNYAIKSAKRKYSYGETLTANDYKICTINNDFSHTELTGAECDFLNHKFNANDEEEATINLTINGTTLSYKVKLIISGECNFSEAITKDNFNKNVINKVVSTKIGSLSLNTTVNASTSGYTLQNDNAKGGIKLGSSTNPVSKVTFEIVNNLTFDAIFIEATSMNTASSYIVKIFVNNSIIYTSSLSNNKTAFDTYGKNLDSPMTGLIKIEFSGSNSIGFGKLSLNIK